MTHISKVCCPSFKFVPVDVDPHPRFWRAVLGRVVRVVVFPHRGWLRRSTGQLVLLSPQQVREIRRGTAVGEKDGLPLGDESVLPVRKMSKFGEYSRGSQKAVPRLEESHEKFRAMHIYFAFISSLIYSSICIWRKHWVKTNLLLNELII